MRFIAAILMCVCGGLSAMAQEGTTMRYEPNWESLKHYSVPEWYQDAKFGIFIHWGVYSVPAWGPKGKYSEWYWHDMQNKNGETWKFHARTYGEKFQYQDFAPMFKAEMFDPAQWADIFARSGAKYIVLTFQGREQVTVFSFSRSHSEVLRAALRECPDTQAISAGFFMADGNSIWCSGGSESLGLAGRPEDQQALEAFLRSPDQSWNLLHLSAEDQKAARQEMAEAGWC